MEEESFRKEDVSARLCGKNFPVESDKDLVTIREFGRKLGMQIGFGSNDQTLIATALSEICRNVLEYAGTGKVIIQPVQSKKSSGITIIVSDMGPGIEDVEKAMQEGYSTSRGMGIGLPGTRRIMDDFWIDSKKGVGTTVKRNSPPRYFSSVAVRHVVNGDPFRWDLLEGAKGVQLAEIGYEASEKRAWMDVPPLT